MSTTSVAVYVRQSVEHAEGIQRQLARCRALVEARGWTVAEEFEDNATSATKARGPQSAWSRLLASPHAVVVAVDLDRLVRSQRDLLTLLEAGKRVVTVDGEIDLSTADGEFRATMIAALARFEVRRKGERSVRANADRVARRGLPVPGKRRFGFEPGNLRERPNEADMVRAACRDMLAGRSLRSIAIEWGRPPVRVREILTNPSYAGWVVRQGERFEAAPEVARIVDRDAWTAVQDLLADESRRVSPGPTRKHLLSGIARCECGASMRALSVYYKCSADSSHATIYRRDLEPHVKGYLALDLLEESGRPGEGELGPLAGRLRELEEERDRWTRAAGLPGASFPLIERELNQVVIQIQEVAAQLAETRVSSHVQRLLQHMADAAKDLVIEGNGFISMDFDAWLEYFDALDLDAQRALVDNRLIVTVAKGRGLERVKIESRSNPQQDPMGITVNVSG